MRQDRKSFTSICTSSPGSRVTASGCGSGPSTGSTPRGPSSTGSPRVSRPRWRSDAVLHRPVVVLGPQIAARSQSGLLLRAASPHGQNYRQRRLESFTHALIGADSPLTLFESWRAFLPVFTNGGKGHENSAESSRFAGLLLGFFGVAEHTRHESLSAKQPSDLRRAM